VKFDGEAGSCNDTCTNTAQIGEIVAEMKVAVAPPTPQGGTLRSGTYVVTELLQYTGPDGEVGPTGLERSFTIRINATNEGAAFDSAYVHMADKCQRYWQSGKLVTWGTWIKISIACWTAHPAPQELVAGFTATDDKLVVFNSPTNTVTFVRQP